MKTAIIKVGERTIEIPVHDEIMHAIKSCENGLHDVPYEFRSFIRSFLPQDTIESYIEFDGVKVAFIEKVHIMESIEYSLKKSIPSEYTTDAFNELARKLIPSSMRPPTEKQLWYAKKIAAMLDIDFPDEAGMNVAECSKFIEEYKGQYLEEQENNNFIEALARKGARGYIALFLLLNEKGDVAILMGVSKKETVEKYIQNFAVMVESYNSFELNQQKLCLSVLNEIFIYNYEYLNLQGISLDEPEDIGDQFKQMLNDYAVSTDEKE